MAGKICKIKIEWDDGYWIAESDNELGITLESQSFDKLLERVRLAVPEMLELNFNYNGEYQIQIEAERLIEMKTAV